MAINKATRNQVYNKFKGHCSYCGREITLKEMQVDHAHPKHLGHFYESSAMKEVYKCKGDNVDALENLMPACRRCNHYKRGDNIEGFREKLLTLHERLSRNYIYKVAKDFGIAIEVPFDGLFYFEKLSTEQV